MQEMTDYFNPSLLISETHFALRAVKGALAAAVARIAEAGFYRGVGITEIADEADRRRIGNIVRERGLLLTYWMSLILAGEKLNLSALDESLRKRSVARIKRELAAARECGADALGVQSGPDPGPEQRENARKRLRESLCELAEAAQSLRPMRVLLEPMDRGAHKNGLLGPTEESADFIRGLTRLAPNIGVCWDTAHAALCGEDVLAAMKSAHDVIHQIHLANAVLDRRSPDFGDHHLPTGCPGFLTVEGIADLFFGAVAAGLFGKDRRPCVAMEIRAPQGGDPWATEIFGRNVLIRAWKLYCSRMSP